MFLVPFDRSSPNLSGLKWDHYSYADETREAQRLAKLVERVSAEVLERRAQEKLLPFYEKRRAVLKSIPKFWPVALMNHSLFAVRAQHNADQVALSFLEDVWIVRDPVETRCFTLEFVRCHSECPSVHID